MSRRSRRLRSGRRQPPLGAAPRGLAAVALAACAGLATVTPSRAAPPPAPAPPEVERITAHLYRVGKVVVDTAARTVTCRGAVNMDAGAIEYLAVAPGGKTHESLLRLDLRPLHLQVAPLMLNLEPGTPVRRQGDRSTPIGATVWISVHWRSTDGAPHSASAEQMVAVGANGGAMPAHPWVFTGSRILKEGFQADLERSLVAVWHDPAAILDNPLAGGGDNGYMVNGKRTPPRGTPVEVVFGAGPPPARAPARPPAGRSR